MKLLAAIAAAVLLSSALTGCAEESSNMSAQYPPPPGADGPEPAVAASDPAAIAPPQQGRTEANAESAFAPQASDIQVGADATQYADTDPSALADFKPVLDPYGSWAEDTTYGTVWSPSPTVVGSDFSPYVTAGHWAYDNDYVWVSDYDWGWAPFHYGRWVYIGGSGWAWIPGRTYAGAWVSWRHGYDDWGYVGWAPMPPTWYWRGGYAVGIGYVPVAPFVFCHSTYLFYDGGPRSHIVAGPQVAVVASHTRPYVPANPTVGGYSPAHPAVGGPPPRSLGIPSPPGPGANRGLARAQQFANPGTAASVGGHPPQQALAQHLPASVNPGPQPFGIGGSAPSHYGAYNGGATTLGQHAPVASAPQYRGVAPTPHPQPYYSGPTQYGGSAPSAAYSAPRYAAPSPANSAPHYSAAPSYSAPHYSAPSPSYSAPHNSAAPSYSAPHYSAPAGGGYSQYSAPSGGGFHTAAPTVVAPTFHAPQPSFSAPAPHHSAGGGGGFRGGSRGGGRR